MKKKNLSRTMFAVKNSFFNILYQVVNTLANIIIPPLIISKFGSAINGLISTVKQIMSYVQLVGAGISESTVVSLYKPLNDKDNKKVSSIFVASQKAFNQAGIIFSLISLIIAFIYPLFILKEQLDYHLVVLVIISLCVAGASEFFVIGKCRAILSADQRLYIVNIAQMVGSILSTFVTIILIKLDANIILVEFAASATYIFRLFILSLYVKKHYNYLDKSEAPDMSAISKRKDATIHQLASLAIFGSQTLFIANFCGLKEVSVYSVYSLIFTGINTILSTASSAMLPGFGNIIATESNEKLQKAYNIYESFFFIFSFIIFTVACVMIIPFISIYTKGITDTNYIRSSFAILFTIMGLLNCIRTPGATIINAGGYYKETKNRALIEMAICIILQFLLVHKFEVIGILIGTITAYLYRTIDVIVYSHKNILKMNTKKTLRRIIYNIILMICIILGFNLLLDVNCNNYIIWIIFSMTVTIICAILYLILNLIIDKDSIKEIIEHFKQLIVRS